MAIKTECVCGVCDITLGTHAGRHGRQHHWLEISCCHRPPTCIRPSQSRAL